MADFDLHSRKMLGCWCQSVQEKTTTNRTKLTHVLPGVILIADETEHNLERK